MFFLTWTALYRAFSNSRCASQMSAPLVTCRPTAVSARSNRARTRAGPSAAASPPMASWQYSSHRSTLEYSRTARSQSASSRSRSSAVSAACRSSLIQASHSSAAGARRTPSADTCAGHRAWQPLSGSLLTHSHHDSHTEVRYAGWWTLVLHRVPATTWLYGKTVCSHCTVGQIAI